MCQVAAAEHLHRLNGDSPDEVVDVRVSVDGTWSKHSFIALYGVVCYFLGEWAGTSL